MTINVEERSAKTIAYDPTFAQDVLDGLGQDQKAIPSRWLYDMAGSELFEKITDLPEYYPTRTETTILRAHAAEIAEIVGPGALLVEYGAGASTKTRILLDQLDDIRAYVPIDISASFLAETATRLKADYPGLTVRPVPADFMTPVDLTRKTGVQGQPVGFFPGSTIGNLDDAAITDFLTVARTTLGPDGLFLIGIDLRKSPDILIPAYDDAADVTAAFNLNLLRRINRELGGTFDLDQFEHEARWIDRESQIEMHLVSLAEQTATVLGESFHFVVGESIHTEISRKFRIETIKALADESGWQIPQCWQDTKGYFCVALLSQA